MHEYLLSLFSQISLRPRYLFSSFVFLSLLCFATLKYLRKPGSNASSQRGNPLKALVQIINPRCSLWPPPYASLASSTPLEPIRIPLRKLIEDVILGHVELRSNKSTLERLISGNGKLDIDGWDFIFPRGSLRITTLWWWIASNICTGKYAPACTVSNPDYDQKEKLQTPEASRAEADGTYLSNDPSSVSDNLKHTSVSGFDTLRADPALVCVIPALLATLSSHILRRLAVAATLDTVHQAHLETALSAIQASVPAGDLALLEFSSCERPLSDAWFLSVLPFQHQKYPSSRRGAAAPYTEGLPRVLTLIKSGNRCTVVSVQNVSRQYAQLLYDYAIELEGRRERSRFISRPRGLGSDDEASVQAWRAEMFWARWEAACYARGLLAKWVICMKNAN
ncbi:hypothetical protein BU17DRAFT_92344 [Hysterangium stoloniferum]|nr:hypothetical protein BU17DRAFT_92344 [Hysterangium stoloniferum]